MKTKKVMKLHVVLLYIFIIILLGILMNSMVVQENNCKMPVLSNYNIETDRHFSYTDYSEVNKPILSDRFKVFGIIYSIGDFFIYFGFLLFLVYESYFIYLNWRVRDEKENKLG